VGAEEINEQKVKKPPKDIIKKPEQPKPQEEEKGKEESLWDHWRSMGKKLNSSCIETKLISAKMFPSLNTPKDFVYVHPKGDRC
jgi:hypothetical protein